jgi:D-alanyl-D-alanine carboxypeptidase (penicillin-binding protein 5/6)
MMNAMAQKLGMTNTHFENPTGLPHPDHYTTSRDLATLTWHIIHDYPDHFKLYDIKSFTYNNITQHNRVLLLWRDPRVDGMKTGHTDAAGYCQVTTAINKDGMRLIAVVMGTKSTEARAVESEKLLNYGFRFFQNYTAYQAGKTLASPRIWLGTENHVNIGIQHDLTVTVPNGSTGKLKVDTQIDSILKAPVKKGDKLGSISISLDGKVMKTEPLVALQDVPEAGFLSRLWDHILMFFESFIS